MAIRDTDQLMNEADPDFQKDRYRRKTYEFGSGESKRTFWDRMVPGEPYSWIESE